MTLHPDHMALLLKAVRKVPEADADAAWSHISARLRRCGDEPRAQDVKQIAGDVVRRFGASCWHHLSEPQQRGGEHRRLYPSGTSDVARAHAQPGAAVDPTAAPRQPLTGKTMTYTPFQWRNFHDRVLDLWRVFVASYGADTGAHTIGGGKWICADSGTAKEATEAERLRTLAAAHAAGAMTGNGNTRDSVIKLRAMGRGGSLPTDTGAS